MRLIFKIILINFFFSNLASALFIPTSQSTSLNYGTINLTIKRPPTILIEFKNTGSSTDYLQNESFNLLSKYYISINRCSSNIAPGKKCYLYLSPSRTIPVGPLSISANGYEISMNIVKLTADNQPINYIPNFTVSPYSNQELSFLTSDRNKLFTLTIKNTGNIQGTPQLNWIDNLNNSVFSINRCSTPVQPGKTCIVYISFKKPVTQQIQTLSISSNENPSVNLSIQFTLNPPNSTLASCVYNSITYQSGSIIPGFNSNRVPFGQNCLSQSGTCNNGSIINIPASATCSPDSSPQFLTVNNSIDIVSVINNSTINFTNDYFTSPSPGSEGRALSLNSSLNSGGFSSIDSSIVSFSNNIKNYSQVNLEIPNNNPINDNFTIKGFNSSSISSCLFNLDGNCVFSLDSFTYTFNKSGIGSISQVSLNINSYNNLIDINKYTIKKINNSSITNISSILIHNNEPYFIGKLPISNFRKLFKLNSDNSISRVSKFIFSDDFPTIPGSDYGKNIMSVSIGSKMFFLSKLAHWTPIGCGTTYSCTGVSPFYFKIIRYDSSDLSLYGNYGKAVSVNSNPSSTIDSETTLANTPYNDNPSEKIVLLGSDIYFSAKNNNGLRKLYRYSDLSNSITQISNTNPLGSDDTLDFSSSGGRIFFVSKDQNGFHKLFRFNPISNEVEKISNLNSSGSDSISNLIDFQDSLFFVGPNKKLFKLESNQFKQISNNNPTGEDQVKNLVVLNNKLLFSANNSNGNSKLFSLDSTENLKLELDINGPTISDDPKNIVYFDNSYIFSAVNQNGKIKLFKSFKTGSFSQISNINGDLIDDDISYIKTTSSKLYFVIKSNPLDNGVYSGSGDLFELSKN